MFNVLDRLRNIKLDDPGKFKRICDHLQDLQRRADHAGGEKEDKLSAKDHEKLLAIRKATDDFFTRLATVDRASEGFWKSVGSRWIGQTEPEDLPQPEDARRRKSTKRPVNEQLIKTIMLAPDPQHALRLALEYNHPQRILNQLLLNRDRRAVLYGLRMKFGLSLPSYLMPRQDFAAQGDFEESPEADNPNAEDDRRQSNLTDSGKRKRSSPYRSERGSLVAALLESSKPRRRSETHPSLDSYDYEDHKKPRRITLSPEKGPVPLARIPSDEDDAVTDMTLLEEEEPAQEKEEHSKSSAEVHLSSVAQEKESKQVSFIDDTLSERKSTEAEDEGGGGMDQYRLQRLKIIFEESDTDDEPGLDINEFKQAMKKIIGENVPEREIELIFMKVDANCDGNVDWNEFLEYTLREFQERDLMTQLTRENFFEKHPAVVPGSTNQREIRTVVWAPRQGYGKGGRDGANGRYYSLNREAEVICWTGDFKKVASFDLIPDIRGKNAYVRANDLCVMPEIKVLVVSLTTGDVNFYTYDDIKLDVCLRVGSLKNPVLCLSYFYHEHDSLLLLGDQSGKVSVISFKNLLYDGLLGSLQIPHSHNPRTSWNALVKTGKAYQVKGQFGSDWISQVKFVGPLNSVIACSADPEYSMSVIPFHRQREPTYFSQREGFNCFDYSEFLNVIVTGSKSRSVQLWNLDNTLNPTMHFDGHEANIDKVAAHREPEFMVVISVDSNHSLKVWDCKDQSCLQTFEGRFSTVPHYMTTFLVYNAEMEHAIFGARDILMLKRISLTRKGPVDQFQKTHDQPLVATLYNDLFECVVTACQESVIMVWNFLTGDKIIQFRNVHTVVQNGKVEPVPIKSACFDANKRRLLTCGSDGLVKVWNFNNGACLSFFDQLAGTDLNVVRYQKNRDLVVTAGWNRSVFMVRDTRGEDEVDETEYDWEKLHRADVTALEIIYTEENQLEYEKKSNSQDFLEPEIKPRSESSYIVTKVKRKSIADLRAEQDEMDVIEDSVKDVRSRRSVSRENSQEGVGENGTINIMSTQFNENPEESLLEDKMMKRVNLREIESDEKPSKSSSDTGQVDAGSGSNSDNDDSKSGSGSGSGSGESESSSAAELRRLSDDSSYAVTASSDGELIIWHLFTGTPVCFLNTDGCPMALSRMARDIYAAKLVSDFPKVELKDSGSLEQFLTVQMAPHTNSVQGTSSDGPDEPVPIPKSTRQARNCVTNMLVLATRDHNDSSTASVITASTDGFIRAWSIKHTGGGLKGLFFAGHTLEAFVQTMCTDSENEILFTGDTTGYVKIWLLCEWIQAPAHLENHRHLFNPRNFPFIKRHKYFAPLIAFRANNIMQLSIAKLPPAQHGFYQQPYILNSFRAHLKRINRIEVVFDKKVLITASEDCSVRLWNFSGLYIGTLGQQGEFQHFMASFEPPKDAVPSAELEMSSSAMENVDDLLDENEDPNEVLLKPKVIVPKDIAEKGSATTLQVLQSTRHKHTVIPEAEVSSQSVNESGSAGIFKNHVEYVAALGELNVVKHQFDETHSAAFRYFGHEPVCKAKGDEELMFTKTPLREIDPMVTLEDVVPRNLFEFNLAKVQTGLLESLPSDLRKPYMTLFKAGKLVGNALEDLKSFVKARETGLSVPRATKQLNIRVQRKVRLRAKKESANGKSNHSTTRGVPRSTKETSSTRDGTSRRTGLAEENEAAQRTAGQRTRDSSTPSSPAHHLQPGSAPADAIRSIRTPSKQRSHSAASATTKKNTRKAQKVHGPPSGVGASDPSTGEASPVRTLYRRPGENRLAPSAWRHLSDTVKALSTIRSTAPVNEEPSEESLDSLPARPSDLNRIELDHLRRSDLEFVGDLAAEQRKNAKFDYLELLEKDQRSSQQNIYLPVIKRDKYFYKEIKPMIVQSAVSVIPAGRKGTVKAAKSTNSMDRIQRVFHARDYSLAPKADDHHGLRLTVPPAPRRLPSVIKGQITSAGKRSVTAGDLRLHEQENEVLDRHSMWGDQESLLIFEPKFTAARVHGKRKTTTSLPMPSRLSPEAVNKVQFSEKVLGGKRKMHRGTVALLSELASRKLRKVPKERPFTNRYLYRQLSDSVFPDYKGGTDHRGKQEVAPVDLEGYLKNQYNKEEASNTKSSAGLRHMQTGKVQSLRDLELMMDKAKNLEQDILRQA